jgi:hypothetical protein
VSKSGSGVSPIAEPVAAEFGRRDEEESLTTFFCRDIKPLATAGARRCDEEPPPAPTTRSGAHGATRRSAVPNQSPRSAHHVHDSPPTPRAWQRRAAVEVRR